MPPVGHLPAGGGGPASFAPGHGALQGLPGGAPGRFAHRLPGAGPPGGPGPGAHRENHGRGAVFPGWLFLPAAQGHHPGCLRQALRGRQPPGQAHGLLLCGDTPVRHRRRGEGGGELLPAAGRVLPGAGQAGAHARARAGLAAAALHPLRAAFPEDRHPAGRAGAVRRPGGPACGRGFNQRQHVPDGKGPGGGGFAQLLRGGQPPAAHPAGPGPDPLPERPEVLQGVPQGQNRRGETHRAD